MATPKTGKKSANNVTDADGASMVEAVGEAAGLVTEPDAVIEDAVVVLNEPDTAEDAAPNEVVEDSTPPHAQKQPEPTPTVTKSGPGFLPLVLGGVVAAGIGFGLANVVPNGWLLSSSSPLKAQLDEQAAAIADLRTQMQAMPKEDATAALMAEVQELRATATRAMEAAEAAEQNSSTDIGPQIAVLTERLAAVESRPTMETAADPAAIAALKTDIATLRSGLEAQQANAASLVKAAEVARAEAAAEAQTVLLKAALTKVEAAMQNGLPFTDDLAMLADAGLTIPQALTDTAEAGLPTLAALSESFDAPARAALEESLRGDMGDTWSERVGSFLRSQTGARSLTPQEGNDPDAVLSRADAAVTAGDLATALTEIAALPEAAQTALSGWVAQVKLRNDAQAATAELSAALSER